MIRIPVGLTITMSGVVWAFIVTSDDPTQVTLLIITTVAGFAGTLAQQMFASSRAKRDREWHLQVQAQKAAELREQIEADTRRLSVQARRDASTLRLMVEQRAAEMMREAIAHMDDIKVMIVDTTAKVDENTALTQAVLATGLATADETASKISEE